MEKRGSTKYIRKKSIGFGSKKVLRQRTKLNENIKSKIFKEKQLDSNTYIIGTWCISANCYYFKNNPKINTLSMGVFGSGYLGCDCDSNLINNNNYYAYSYNKENWPDGVIKFKEQVFHHTPEEVLYK